jgi:hypothetical protein
METNNVTQWVIIGIAAVILIGGGFWLAMRTPSTSSNEMASSTNATTTTSTTSSTVKGTNSVPKGSMTTSSAGEAVTVNDQKAGSSVSIASMTLTHASWVAVRDDLHILGAAWFPSNATKGSVELLSPTVSGKAYRTVIYVDDGDKKFDMHKDQLITSGDAAVGTSFKAE